MSDEHPHTAGRTALDLALQQPWLTDRETLETVLAIAGRWSEGPEAVAQRLGRPLANTRGEVQMRGAVAVIPVHGPIFRRANLFTEVSGATSIETLALDFARVSADPAVDSIVLDIDSPGGAASGVAEFANQVRDSEKHVTAYVGSLAASGGYWLAAAADEVVMNETAAVGSVGAVMGLRMEDDPSRIEIVSSQSPKKRIDPRTAEGRQEFQVIVDDLAQVFVDSVARFRGIDSETVLSDFGQGGLMVGIKAVQAGMADRLGSFEEVIAGLSGSTSRGSMMSNIKHPSPDITRDVIAEHYPAIAAAFREEGIGEATTSLGKDMEAAVAKARAEGLAEGAKVERERIQGVEAAALPGHGDLISSLKYDGKTTGAEAALAIVQAERAARVQRGQDVSTDRSGAFVAAGGEEGAGDAEAARVESLPLEERCKAKWDGDPALRAEFGNKFERFVAFERNQSQVRMHRPAA